MSHREIAVDLGTAQSGQPVFRILEKTIRSCNIKMAWKLTIGDQCHQPGMEYLLFYKVIKRNIILEVPGRMHSFAFES